MLSKSIEIILYGFPVARRRPRPAFIHIGRTICLRKTIVALGRGGFDNYAKHFEVDQDGHNISSAARFHQLLVDGLGATAFFKIIIIVSRHFVFIYLLIY
jgi:hypothetical protein